MAEKSKNFDFFVPNVFLYGYGVFWCHFEVIWGSFFRFLVYSPLLKFGVFARTAHTALAARAVSAARAARAAREACAGHAARTARVARLSGSPAGDHYCSKALVGTEYPFEL